MTHRHDHSLARSSGHHHDGNACLSHTVIPGLEQDSHLSDDEDYSVSVSVLLEPHLRLVASSVVAHVHKRVGLCVLLACGRGFAHLMSGLDGALGELKAQQGDVDGCCMPVQENVRNRAACVRESSILFFFSPRAPRCISTHSL